MIGFGILAAILLIAVVALLLAPIIRADEAPPRYLTVLATGAGLPIFAIGLYLAIGNWQLSGSRPDAEIATITPADRPGPESVEAMVAQLAQRLQRQDGSAEEWQMLGRSYMVMARYQDAAIAFSQAKARDVEGDPELLAQYAEALILSDEAALTGEGGQIIEQVLKVSPEDSRALWYGGVAAMQRGDNDLAVQRFQKLLTQNPPDELRQVLLARIAEAGGTTSVEEPAVAANGSPAEGLSLSISVAVAASVLENIDPATPVFVLARSNQPGPPLAAKKMRVADLPFVISLSPQDAMIPGTRADLSQASEVVARIALGGTPQAQAGDLFGAAELSSADGERRVDIVIDQTVK